MSSHSYGEMCPNCGKNMDVTDSNNPYPQRSCQCISCGFTAFMEVEYMDLEELNELREEGDFEPIATLPKQEFGV